MALTEAERQRILVEMDKAMHNRVSGGVLGLGVKPSKPSDIANKYRGKTDEEVRAIFADQDADKLAKAKAAYEREKANYEALGGTI